MPKWPEWWTWELELSPHVLKRMVDRDFNEVALRQMPQDASDFRKDWAPGRWVVATRFQSQPWEVIVEPISEEIRLVVVTAYRTA